MARTNFVLEILLSTGQVIWKPHGNSMTPKIDSGDEVVVKKSGSYQVGDIVYAKVKGNYYLHLLSAIDESQNRYQISNNHGHINGWCKKDAIYGVCVKIKNRDILTAEDLMLRLEATSEASEK